MVNFIRPGAERTQKKPRYSEAIPRQKGLMLGLSVLKHLGTAVSENIMHPYRYSSRFPTGN